MVTEQCLSREQRYTEALTYHGYGAVPQP